MSDYPFIGEIALLPYEFAPRDYVYCEGQTMSISQNQALFAIIGSTYGGDWSRTMAVPNLMSRAPIGTGKGPGLTNRQLGVPYGSTTVSLDESEIPSHDHTWKSLNGNPDLTDGNIPKPNRVTSNFVEPKSGGGTISKKGYVKAPTSYTSLSESTVSFTGNSQAHTNMQPYLGLNYFMATYGEFPARS